ncbi:MAG: FAD-dependent oxidoreductase [Rhizobiales bacterium]|nr:FAD-dependent oxidoreductase [Hyphomicrobiales bacterium]
MTHLTRRRFGTLLASTAAASTLAAPAVLSAAKMRLVIIGGGPGGATVARYVAKGSKDVAVTLIEPKHHFTTCFFSNLYLGGFRTLDSITHSYGTLAAQYGVNMVHDVAVDVDRAGKTVKLGRGNDIGYDRLVVSPGIEMRYDTIEGYSAEASTVMPHAWQAGTQTAVLKKQLEAMDDGGVVVVAPPPNPFRCPPGPYERICMIAHYLKANKPKSKIMVLDAKNKFSKQALFQEAWASHYDGMIEWLPVEVTGGVKAVKADSMEVVMDDETVKAAVANVIPAQAAGIIAKRAGLTNDGGWCPIDPHSMRSKTDENVFVIGDASVASAMPKSGFSANSQAKVAANALLADLTGSKKFPAKFRNTCWSLVATNDGVKVGADYKGGDAKIEVTSKFISKTGEAADLRAQTAEEANGWYAGMTKDMFG